MAILVLFNKKSEYSVNELANLTAIETENDYFYKVMQQLLKAKILLCSNRTLKDDELLTGEDRVHCNDKYRRWVQYRIRDKNLRGMPFTYATF